MIHMVAKWRVQINSPLGMKNEFHIDSDHYAEVLETVSKINFGIDVTGITISLVRNEPQTGTFTTLSQ